MEFSLGRGYLCWKLGKVGITATYGRDILRQAQLIGSAAALDTAISVCLTGISWSLQQQGVSEHERHAALRACLRDDVDMSLASRRLKLIMFEAV